MMTIVNLVKGVIMKKINGMDAFDDMVSFRAV